MNLIYIVLVNSGHKIILNIFKLIFGDLYIIKFQHS